MLLTCPFMWKEHEMPHDYARYTLFALEDLLLNQGFKILVKDKSGNFVQVIFQLIILYFHDTFYTKVYKFPVLRYVFQFFFFFCVNAIGVFLIICCPKGSKCILLIYCLLKKFKEKPVKILVIGHEGSLSGAPILLLNLSLLLIEKKIASLDFIILRDGPLIPEYKKLGRTTVLKNENYGKEPNLIKKATNIFLINGSSLKYL